MTEKIPEDEPDVQRRFQETLERLVNTPHQPHAPLAKQAEQKLGKKRGKQS